MKKPEIAQDFDEAIKRLRTIKGPNNYAELAGDPTTFRLAMLTDRGFCGLWAMEDGAWLLGLGAFDPLFVPTLLASAATDQVRVTIPRSWDQIELEKRSEWNFFLMDSSVMPGQPAKYTIEEVQSADEINTFIDNFAPDSSTKPGDSEIMFWHGIRDEKGDLASIGAAVRWKSGATMVVSIATAPSHRGKAMAQEVTASLVKRLFEMGSPIVGLGVWAHNTPAVSAYRRVGFELQEEFVSGPLLQA